MLWNLRVKLSRFLVSLQTHARPSVWISLACIVLPVHLCPTRPASHFACASSLWLLSRGFHSLGDSHAHFYTHPFGIGVDTKKEIKFLEAFFWTRPHTLVSPSHRLLYSSFAQVLSLQSREAAWSRINWLFGRNLGSLVTFEKGIGIQTLGSYPDPQLGIPAERPIKIAVVTPPIFSLILTQSG